jgi:hypothetical protein
MTVNRREIFTLRTIFHQFTTMLDPSVLHDPTTFGPIYQYFLL